MTFGIKCNECGRLTFQSGGHMSSCSQAYKQEHFHDYEDYLLYQGMSDADYKDMVCPDEGDHH